MDDAVQILLVSCQPQSPRLTIFTSGMPSTWTKVACGVSRSWNGLCWLPNVELR